MSGEAPVKSINFVSGGNSKSPPLGFAQGRLCRKAVSYTHLDVYKRQEPEWVNNKFEPRLILPLSLSYDHRLIDGADAARFLRWIAEAFEQPFLLSVQG